jgi:hypothetical protein
MTDVQLRPSGITLVTGKLADIEPSGVIGLLCEVAADGKFRDKFPDALSFSEIFGSRSEARHRAYVLAGQLVADEPVLRGVQHLRVFEEMLISELERVFLVLNLIDWLRENRITTCALYEESWLSSYSRVLGMAEDITVKVSPRADGSREHSHPLLARAARVYSRIRSSGVSRSTLYQEYRQFLDHVDPFHRRSALRWRRRKWRTGDIWFYTTAHTFTNIGLAFEPYFPAPLNFLVENPGRGGVPLKGIPRSWTSVYEFSLLDFAPSRREVQRIAGRIERHLRNVRLCGADARAREVFLSGEFFKEFCDRLLPMGLYYTRVFETWVKRVRPRALVVGNPVFEAYALLAARKCGVPTIMLQHGTIGADCLASEPPIDYYIVWGKFWQHFLPEKTRNKSQVLNIPYKSEPKAHNRQGRSLLFLTTSYSMEPFWTESDLDDILAVLLQCALNQCAELIIRVHPLERVGLYRGRIESIGSGKERVIPIIYSQGGSLDALLARSAVAVTYSSTVFLDCIRRGIPIVSFDWHHFSYKRQIEKYGMFHFAQNLAHLRELLTGTLQGSVQGYVGTTEPFMADSSEEELRAGIADAVSKVDRQPVPVSYTASNARHCAQTDRRR